MESYVSLIGMRDAAQPVTQCPVSYRTARTALNLLHDAAPPPRLHKHSNGAIYDHFLMKKHPVLRNELQDLQRFINTSTIRHRNSIFVSYHFTCRSKAWNFFARSNTGIVGSNPTQDMDVCVRLFCVSVALCVGSGPATGWSPVQGVLPTMYRIKKLKKRPRSNKTTEEPQIDHSTWTKRGDLNRYN
jgi:hypothetical protein